LRAAAYMWTWGVGTVALERGWARRAGGHVCGGWLPLRGVAPISLNGVPWRWAPTIFERKGKEALSEGS
jgi:hypothetical protein